MRGSLLPAAFVLMLIAFPAHAAPTCQTRNGDTIRCGADGAMPVAWRIPPEQRRADPLGGNGAALLKVGLGLGLFLAFIALLPPFDGSKTSDWDGQNDDDD